MSPHAPKPHIAICVDPFNGESANLMKKHIEAAGGEVTLFSHYSRLVNSLAGHRRPVSFAKIDGIIIMGNDHYDVAPETYNQRPTYAHKGEVHQETHSENDTKSPSLAKDRALFERYLIREALVRKIPLLGICGGMQRINIECGQEKNPPIGRGTLIQHLPAIVGDNRHSQEECGYGAHEATQDIIVKAGTKLAGMIKSAEITDPTTHVFDATKPDSLDSAPGTTIKVSTRHHQAIGVLADGLIPSAEHISTHPQSGHKITVIKAFEADPKNPLYKDHFIMGMQFHPEYVKDHHLGQTLADRFVHKSKGYSATRPHESAYPGKEELGRMELLLQDRGKGLGA